MKTSGKLIATALLASSAAHANEVPFVVTPFDIEQFTGQSNFPNIQTKLLERGILVPANQGEIFILSEEQLSALSDEEMIAIVSDLLNWMSKGKVKQSQKKSDSMNLSSQDYTSPN